ncbi:MAG: family peptidase [Clostridia bacterium]|jgi:D-aminopeptidase|nr:family peptidase [Clostridia bacterium]
MKNQKRIRDYGIIIGKMSPGERNSITDVEGVSVGHFSLINGNINTGVTAVIPHGGNTFREKVVAASYVINGFGKTMGTIQLEELGTIETPIILTNTLSVGTAHQALVEYMLSGNEDIGDTTGTVNPIICECNDGYLNDIRGLHIKRAHIFHALEHAAVEFEEGAAGAGSGMICYGLKGGIGTASRRVRLDDKDFVIGIMVLSNFGSKADLIIDGIKAGEIIGDIEKNKESGNDKGSVIVIMATDIPMTHRQLKRVCKRTAAGLSRTGTHFGNGSGDVVIGFSTANKLNHYEEDSFVEFRVLQENKIDEIFIGAIEATEEAVLNSMICADTTKGRKERIIYSLKEYISEILKRI